jgi:GNAT superfamily N-acetyltransferase
MTALSDSYGANVPTIEFVTPDWPRFGEIIERSFVVLYEPFGLARPDVAAGEADWRLPPPGTDVAVALGADGEILGSAWLLPAAGDPARQVRQVSVDAASRRIGVGVLLMRAIELRAAEQGAHELWLNARDSAFGFYERLGYIAEGDEFVSELTGIPHRLMRESLG